MWNTKCNKEVAMAGQTNEEDTVILKLSKCSFQFGKQYKEGKNSSLQLWYLKMLYLVLGECDGQIKLWLHNYY